MRQQHIPLTGIDDSTHFLPASSQVGREAQLSAWTSQLHDAGIKVFAYNNPYVSATLTGGAADYAYGVDAGYFILSPDGGPSLAFLSSGGTQDVASVDFTNPAAFAWYQTLLQRAV